MLKNNKIYKNNKNIILNNMKVGKKHDINDLKIEGLKRKEMKDLLSVLVNEEKLKVIIDENNKKNIFYIQMH